MPDTDQLTAALAEIRYRSEGENPVSHGWSDVPRLLAVVEAVLGLHAPAERQVRQFCGVHARMPSWRRGRAVNRCRNCREVTKRVCTGCDPVCNSVEWPCATALAIRTALAPAGGAR